MRQRKRPSIGRQEAATQGERVLVLHLVVVLAVSIGFEAVFLGQGLGLMEEGWPLYTAMQLHRGGTLYQDVFWVFPPGHALAAWIAYGLDPPGIVVSRWIYAGFNVALSVVLYLLGRAMMPARFALLGALLAAVAAPTEHYRQQLFGYRYLVFGALALLMLARRRRTGEPRWLFLGGFVAGAGFCFRLEGAAAAMVAVGVGVMAAERDWRTRFRDWLWFTAGVSAAVLPVLLYLASGVGLDTLWSEVVRRPIVMTEMQSLPMPALSWPGWDRQQITQSFVALQFRLYPVVCAVLGGFLLLQWLRAAARRRPFAYSLDLAVVVWAGVFMARIFGRSDEAHLSSVIPPFCLLMAYVLHLAIQAWPAARDRSLVAAGACAAAFAGWLLVTGVDREVRPAHRGRFPVESTGRATWVRPPNFARLVDTTVERIGSQTRPGDIVLNLANSPLLLVLADRMGPGRRDLVMPGTFLDGDEERAFVRHLEQSPPALVIMPTIPFDGSWSRSMELFAPLVEQWVLQHYEPLERRQGSGALSAYELVRRQRSGERGLPRLRPDQIYTFFVPRPPPLKKGD